MPDNTDSLRETGRAPFRFGLNAGANEPDTFHLILLIGATWYETNAVFSEHPKASEYVIGLNNSLAAEAGPFAQGGHIAFAFNSLYEQDHDISRLIIHLEQSVILTGYLIDEDTVSPFEFCRSMNRQTRLSEKDRDRLIMDCIIGPADINAPVTLH